MSRQDRTQSRTDDLISDFSALVGLYDRTTPFDRDAQLRLHRQTIGIRIRHRRPSEAISDPQFIESLYATLQSWGIGVRALILVPIDQFASSLARWDATFDALGTVCIDDHGADVDGTANELWRLIAGIDIVENKAKIVALSKTIHHILPELLPPIDRAYTQKFFGLYPVDFQDRQEQAFRTIWDGFAQIARSVDPAKYVGSGWRTSRTKVIDNAIVAYETKRQSEGERIHRPQMRHTNSPNTSETYSVHALYAKLDDFKAELESVGLKPNTVDTYVGRLKTFIDWLAGRYHPRGPNDPE